MAFFAPSRRCRDGGSRRHARNRFRHRNHRPRSLSGRSAGGDRLRRAASTGFRPARRFHRYLNPERDMPASAFEVHGLSAEFLRDKPLFAEIADEFLDFVGDCAADHSQRDVRSRLPQRRARARRQAGARPRPARRYPAAGAPQASRRARTGSTICARATASTIPRRTKHGALLDAEMLAEVYLELIGARQTQLVLQEAGAHRGDDRANRRADAPVPLAPRITQPGARRASGVRRRRWARLRSGRTMCRRTSPRSQPETRCQAVVGGPAAGPGPRVIFWR